jgi:hypothetical protein
MRMALRAQNQCRGNLETLAALKNPQVIFAKQANALQHLFSRLSRHAIANMEAGYGDAFERYMRKRQPEAVLTLRP